MLSSSGEGRQKIESAKSRLGESLLRLQSSLEQTRHNEARVESLFAAWQRKWTGRRDQIARRLELIESQLERIAQRPEPTIRLSLVGVPADTNEMTAGRPF